MQRIDLYFQKQYNRGSSSVVGTLRSRIEAVITGRTRNALALRGTRVRIPPTPLQSAVNTRYLFTALLNKNQPLFIFRIKNFLIYVLSLYSPRRIPI